MHKWTILLHGSLLATGKRVKVFHYINQLQFKKDCTELRHASWTLYRGMCYCYFTMIEFKIISLQSFQWQTM